MDLRMDKYKSKMTIKTYFSKLENGVANQLCLAMIVYLLILLIKLKLNLNYTCSLRN